MAEGEEGAEVAAETADEPAILPGWWELPPSPIRETVFAYLQDRLRSLEARRHIDGANMLPGWKRELLVMRALKGLYDWLEQQELETAAAADKRKGRRS